MTAPQSNPNWNRFDGLFHRYGERYAVSWRTLKAICMNESTLGTHPRVARGLDDPEDVDGSKSEDGKSWGIMQVRLTTAQWLDPHATQVRLNNPEYSVQLAARYLAILKGMFLYEGDRAFEYSIKAYNQGPGNTKKEVAGTIKGYAHDYWAKFQKHMAEIKAKEA